MLEATSILQGHAWLVLIAFLLVEKVFSWRQLSRKLLSDVFFIATLDVKT